MLIDWLWRRKHLQVIGGLFFGLLGGLVIAYALSLIVNLVASFVPSPPPASHPGLPPEPPEQRSPIVDGAAADRGGVSDATVRAAPGAIEATSADDSAAYASALQAYVQKKEAYDRRLEAYATYRAHVQALQLVKLVLGATAVFLCVSFVLQTKDDFRFVIPYVEFSRQAKGTQPLLLDTSAIIDGRIADIAETRIFDAEVIVPRFILAELQGIADSDNKLKRNRGRRGLDVLNRLRSSDKLDIRIMDVTTPGVREIKEADAKLVALAGHLDARVVTNDYNLNKVARLHDVTVININDLANALKPVVLPGESMRVKVVKPGEETGQGVGYLDDGTMVVVEKGRDRIGEEVEIAVTSVLQTSAGRMIFGQCKNS
ncbi:MAG: TRAM domain-containing protein [Phycisphaerae bacterium]|nr:TRAM domain-containing protein [Phycisphaerae bacterium]